MLQVDEARRHHSGRDLLTHPSAVTRRGESLNGERGQQQQRAARKLKAVEREDVVGRQGLRRNT